MKRNRFAVALILVSAAWRGAGQTSVDLSRQGKLGAGTVLPAKCAVGQVFLKTDAAVGANLYACTVTDTWTAMGVLNLTGDVSGSQQASTVQGIQGRGVSNAAPADRNVLRWNAATSKWEPGTVPTSGSSTPPSTCASGSFYLQNDGTNNIHQLYVCSDTNAWSMASLRSGTAGTRPGSCVLGQTWLSTDSGALTYCSATGTPGTWSAIAGSGGGSSNPSTGPRNAVQMSDGSGGFVGYSGVTSDGSKLSVGVPAQLSGFSATASGSSPLFNDPNYHRGFDLSYQTSGEGLNFGFSGEAGLSNSMTVRRGFNDSWQASKYTALGLNNTVLAPASGQRFGMSNSITCWGMGDCYGMTQSVTQFGGLNDNGGEGTGHSRFTLSQGTRLIQTQISSVPSQSQCTGTITQAVSKSTGGAAQSVNFTKTSGAGTCLKDEWVDFDRGAVFVDTNQEVTQLTADYSGGHLSAVFETDHLTGAAVAPATVLNVYDTYQMGEGRYLVNLSSARHSGTIAGISDRIVTINDGISANVVGGDAVLPGIIKFDQDDYTGPPFYATNDTSTLHSFYAVMGLQSPTSFYIAHKSPVGFTSYTGKAAVGGGYQILRGARVWRIVDGSIIVLEANPFTWTAGDTVENAISVDGVVDNTNLFSWYTPGATLYDAMVIKNAGPRSWQTAIAISSQSPTDSNADATSFDTGISLYGNKPFGVGIGIGQTQKGAIVIGAATSQSNTVNSNILWQSNEVQEIDIGPHGNTLTPGALVLRGGTGDFPKGSILFGDLNSLTNTFGSTTTASPQFQAWGNVMATKAMGPGSAWLGILAQGDATHFTGWRMESDGSPNLYFHYLYKQDTDTYEQYPFSISSTFGGWAGPTVPKQNTATSTTNYASSTFGLQGSLWHAGAARNVGALLDVIPEAGGTDALFDFRIRMYDHVNNNVDWPNTPLRLTDQGVMTIGFYNDGFGPDHRATIDPSGITAHRTYTLPDASGAVALSGASQAVSFGTISAGSFIQGTSATPAVNAGACTGATIDPASTNLAGSLTGLPAGTCTVTLTFSSAAAAHGWSCSVSDQTTGNLFRKTASTTTSITFSGTSASGDVLSYGPCAAY